MVAILNFRMFWQKWQNKNAYILKTMLDRADYANFGCHNSIRLEAEHFLNTLALTFISFSGRFVFAVQKHYLFFASDPLVTIDILIVYNGDGPSPLSTISISIAIGDGAETQSTTSRGRSMDA